MASTSALTTELEARYADVVDVMRAERVRVDAVGQRDGRLRIRATAPSEQAKDRVWVFVKQAHPGWSADLVCEIGVAPAPARPVPPLPAPAIRRRR